MSLQVRRLTTERDLAGLADAWSALAAQSGQSSPFLSHDWFWCCWQAASPQRRPEIAVVEEGGTPLALIPLAHSRERVRGLPVRCLEFLDSPDTLMVDLLTADDHGLVISSFLDHLSSRSDWDVLRLQKLPATSPTLKALESGLPGRFWWRRTGTLRSPYLVIEGDWASFYGAKSQRFKKTCRNIQNRLERAGQVTVEEHRSVAPSDRVFEDVIDITRRSWKADRGVAIATMNRMPEFFGELTRRATARGWLSLWLLRLDGQAVAMEYQLVAAGRVHALRADYDLAYRELSPGSALNFAIARALFGRADIREYDMGPGLNDYKLRWASGSHETVSLRIYRSHAYSRLLYGLEAVLLPAARRLRQRLTVGDQQDPARGRGERG